MADRAILRFLAIPSGIFASFASPSKSPWTIVFCIVEEDRGKDKKRFLQEDDDRERERAYRKRGIFFRGHDKLRHLGDRYLYREDFERDKR